MDIESTLVRKVVDRLTRIAHLDRIILFGSAATGHMSKDSDIDLLILQPAVTDTRRESQRLRAALIGLGIPFDVIVMRSDRFDETKDVIGGLAYLAHRYGKVIYEAA